MPAGKWPFTVIKIHPRLILESSSSRVIRINVRVGITSGCSNIKGISGVDIREQGIKERIGIISDCGKIKGSSGVGIKEREIKEPVAIISECVNINGISGAGIRCAP